MTFTQKKQWLTGAMIALILVGIAGCITFQNPHDNFVEIMNSLIGKEAVGRKTFEYGYLGNSIERNVLENGNTEYVYDHTHRWDTIKCLYALEVDTRTWKFVGWRYLSDPKACYSNP